MSGYEPGRPKIEWRESDLIWVGTQVLNEHGREFAVVRCDPLVGVDSTGGEHLLNEPGYRCRVR